MIKVIKHGTAFHAYKCSKCDCIFTASKRDIENEDINGLLYCPECGYYIFEHDIIDDKKINQETINVPSCQKVGEHDKKYEAINTSATTATVDSSKKDGFIFCTFDEYK